ncbi:hypothetical protein JL722_3451 [Aureococcus anophagefferens]|nr:hypothetical protein JL722_3451 [Aureococcus anophagefferens]
MLKLMEMNDNHVEYHTVKEFLVFCVDGPSGAGAGTWTSTFPGEYLKGGAAAGGQLVDQRLLPRISEGEVRVLMAGDTCQMIIHKKPEGGLSAVGGNSAYTYYEPSDPLYADLLTKLTTDIKNGLMDVLDLKGEALPLLWTCDYIPKNPEGWSKTENACDMETEYVVGEFNCSCVGVSMFQAVCGGDKTLADVRYNTLLPSPVGAKYSLAVVQFKVPGHPNGGSDKGPDGNRIDSIPIASGVIKAGGACDMLLYDYTDHAGFEATIEKYDALIVRINPGQLSQIPGVDGVQAKFDATMNAFVGKGKPVWSSPGVQQKMGAKDALCKIANMGCGLVDTFAYYDAETLETQFKKTMAFQPRVVKQNRGSAGEGIWLCWIANETKDGIIPDIEYPSKTFGAESLGDDVMLKLMEMNDNHVEYHTVKEFLVFCVDGPSGAGAGTWTSTFPGEYLKGGAAGGQLVDQRLLPRISEGEVRVLMAGDTCQMIIHKKPEGGLSALTTDIKNGLMDVLDLKGEALPLLWTCDYIPKNPEGWSKTENACDMETEYVVGEFNCSCVGVSMFQAVCGGDKTLADVPDADYYEACKLTDLMGIKALEMLDTAAASRSATTRCCRRRRVPSRRACDMLLYDYTDHAGFEATIEKYDALIVRINPGQLSQIPGVDGVQAKFDATMNAFVGKGKPIANMGCGLVDTFAYYDAETLETQFKKTMAFQPRVVKQNRGSAGEGIWLCWIANATKDGIIPDIEYPSKTFGAESLGDDVMLKLMEMNDNHVEYHTVKEFLVFCVDGPSGAGAGTWTSTFPGEYLKGGAAGGQLVDQRLLPRISEGEVRVLMAGDTCQMIIHKKPEGGLSAVGGNSAYTYYEPSDPLYADLLTKLTTDIKNGLMDVLDLKGEALPLLWTCDYIPKNPEGWSKTENACDMETEYVVGEFNCSCVGVSMFQAVCGGDKTLADVPDADYYEACKLTDLMGIKALEMLDTKAAA